jgi:hypothetical protein
MVLDQEISDKVIDFINATTPTRPVRPSWFGTG